MHRHNSDGYWVDAHTLGDQARSLKAIKDETDHMLRTAGALAERQPLLGTSPPRLEVSPKPPTVVMLVGLQGSGKTTTAGKLAVQIRKMGHKPLLVAADPYRPAAVAQLQTLGKQIDVPVYHEQGKKPPELAQAAVKYAQQNGESFVILDTAGRLQINEELMRELEAITSKVSPTETLLVADAMTGQEAVRVSRAITTRAPEKPSLM